jgi:site-specific recombinase XerD
MIKLFFSNPKTIQRMYEGPLGHYIDGYAALLDEQGYSKQSACSQTRLVNDLSIWLHQQGFKANDVNETTIDMFLKDREQHLRLRRGECCTLNRLLDYFRKMEIVRDKLPPTETSGGQGVEDDFKRYLLQERGLSHATVLNYIPFIKKFLLERFDTDPIRFGELQPADITEFVKNHAYDLSHGRARLMVTALRVFLRYLRHRKDIIADLASCVPTVANWQLSTLPKFLQPEQVQDVLEHCDRQSSVGRRNYAILLLLARLGFRACEVVALQLEDIGWESGYINIRGKGGQLARFPLPQDVGESIALYLQNGRPRCSTRRVFVRHKAPIFGFANSSTISSIVRRALEHAGINSHRKGAHLFRHTLATEMLRQGASLAEIGELLRHHSPNTTMIYAKVDVTALRALAQPWPGGAL